MRAATVRREPTLAERRKRAVAQSIADRAFADFVATLPADPVTRRLACERLTRLTGAQVAADHGEAALHCALSGAVVAGAPAYRTARPVLVAAEALFSKPDPANSEAASGPKSEPLAGFGRPSATLLASSLKSASAAKFSGGDQ